MNDPEIIRPSWDKEPLPLVAGEAYAKVCEENKDLNRDVAAWKIATGIAFFVGFCIGGVVCLTFL